MTAPSSHSVCVRVGSKPSMRSKTFRAARNLQPREHFSLSRQRVSLGLPPPHLWKGYLGLRFFVALVPRLTLVHDIIFITGYRPSFEQIQTQSLFINGKSSPLSTFVSTTNPLGRSYPMPRSRKGCNTCKKRHRKCDETKPACRMCEAYGLQCEGYAVTLRWTNDVAASGPPSGSRRQLQGTADHRRQDTKHLQRKQPAAISGSSGGGSRQRCRPGSELGGLATSGISSPHDSYTSKRSYSNSSSNKDRPVLLPRPEALSANAPPLDGQSPEDLALPGNTHTTSHPDLRIQPADHDGDTFRLLDDCKLRPWLSVPVTPFSVSCTPHPPAA